MSDSPLYNFKITCATITPCTLLDEPKPNGLGQSLRVGESLHQNNNNVMQ